MKILTSLDQRSISNTITVYQIPNVTSPSKHHNMSEQSIQANHGQSHHSCSKSHRRRDSEHV